MKSSAEETRKKRFINAALLLIFSLQQVQHGEFTSPLMKLAEVFQVTISFLNLAAKVKNIVLLMLLAGYC